VPYESFVDKELIHFSQYDLERSIPSLVDGLKVSQRKIMFSCFKRNLVEKEIRVAQLAAYVSENASYHHGEASLQAAIVSMAQDFVGANNINLLMPNGQFGSRRVGGKDASQPRYIHTLLNPVATRVFMKEDQPVVNYLDDDGMTIEPEFYVPIIPMVLVNGALGIGTGFSTNIPCYNPLDVVNALRMFMSDESAAPNDIKPWYNGFEGVIENVAKSADLPPKYVSRGVYTRAAPTKVRVTELPIGVWTEDFKVQLEEMLEVKDTPLKSYESNYNHVKVDFTLVFQSAAVVDDLLTSNVEQGGVTMTKFEQMFKMVSSRPLSTSNMYLFNEKAQITKYDSAIHIIKAFYSIRLEYYEKRKEYQLAKLLHDAQVYENKVRFIKEVVSGSIPVSTLTKKDLEQVLEERTYMKVDDAYDYLTRIPIYNLTTDKVRDLEADMLNSKASYDTLNATSVKEIWMKDLDMFEAEYRKYLQQRAAKQNATDASTVAPGKKIAVRAKKTA
jgi:DNA topoisomerase-2